MIGRDGGALIFLDIADIGAAEAALADLNKDQATHRNLTSAQLISIGDLNGDGLVTNAELQGFINLLANGGASGSVTALPTPSAFVLLALALPVCGWVLRRKLLGRKGIVKCFQRWFGGQFSHPTSARPIPDPVISSS